MRVLVILLFFINLTLPHPVPEEDSTGKSTISLKVIPDENDLPSSSSDDAEVISSDDETRSQKRHTTSTPSPEELEERRQAFIKSLGGGEDSAPVLVSSLQGLGSLATDVVALLTSNANETFGPLREARMRARENFPDLGTQFNRYFRNGREYVSRSYRSLVKNLRVKMTNLIRFMLQAVTRLSSTVSGLYSIVVSLLDVTTRGVQSGARVGSRLLSVGSNATVNALTRGSSALRSIGESGLLAKPLNTIVTVGRGLAKGLSEDLFDKVEWTQEGLNAKLELGQALAPNFLLRAHEKTTPTPSPDPNDDSAIEIDGGFSGGSYQPPSTTASSEIYVKYNAGDTVKVGGYAKLHDDDDLSLDKLAAAASDIMMRGGREVSNSTTTTKEPSSTKKSIIADEGLPPQGLLNDIFGLEQEINDLKKNLTESGIPIKD